MTQLALSNDLNVLTEQIHFFKSQAGQAIFEIGSRLKHVKENNLVHGQWESWCENSLNISSRQARKYIRVFERFSNRNLSSDSVSKLDMLAEFTDEEIETPVQLPSGEIKTPIDMTNKEIEEYKRQAKEAEQRAKQAEQEKIHWQGVAKSAQNRPPQVVTQTIEVVPSDYNSLKQQANQLQELSTENVKLKRSLIEQRELMSRQEKNDHALKELKKFLSELLRNASMNHETAIFYFNELDGNREAHMAVTNFLTQYSEICTKHFTEWKSLTAIKAVN